MSIDGSNALLVSIDKSTRMGADDLVRFTYTDVSGIEKNIELRGLDGSVYSSVSGVFACSPSIAVGDRVVRGISWDWGQQDGGAGSFGEVTAIKEWRGKAGAGVCVTWRDSGFEGLYRWDYEGCFDLKILGSLEKNANPISIPSSSLKVSIISDAGVPSSLYGFRCIVSPIFSATTAMGLPKFKSDLERLRSEYSIGTLAHDEALISYINRESVSKGMDKKKLLRCSWDDIVPNETSLASMPLLKDLNMMSVPTHSYCQVPAFKPHVIIPPLDPTDKRRTNQHSNDLDTKILFQLPTDVDMRCKIFWVSATGEMVVHNEISGPGSEYEQCTQVGHVWVVQFRQKELGRYVAVEEYGVVRIPELQEVEVEEMDDSLPSLPRCPTGHGMKLLTELPGHYEEDSDVFCDSCEAPSIQENIFFFNCEECGYDLCGNCVSENCLPKPRCPAQHRMVRLGDYEYPVTPSNPNPVPPFCDNCRTHDLPNVYSFFYHCEPCMHDLCPLCGVLASPIGVDSASNALKQLQSRRLAPVRPIKARLYLLQLLNKSLEKALPFFDLTLSSKEGTISNLLTSCRGLIFTYLKSDVWNGALEETETQGEMFSLTINRFRASKHARKGVPDFEVTKMCFSQAFRQIHNMNPSVLRRSGQLYETCFVGEKGQDVGGLYRETLTIYCQELQSPTLDLMIPTPNARQTIGQNRDRWIPNPGATTAIHREMFVFLGKLMAIAVRGKNYLSLNMPSLVWKLIVGENVFEGDLEAVDQFQVISLRKLRNIDQEGITSATFSDIFFETFSVISSDNRTVDLIPGGSEIPVLFENRVEYCNLVLSYRLKEFDSQIEAIREGISMILPISLVCLFSWEQFERLVCGDPVIDVNLLRSVTEYSSNCSVSDRHIEFFWRAMEEFNQEERAAFLRFTWGRTRLPLNESSFTQRFKISTLIKNNAPADSFFPVAHTCFFSLDLPPYSSLEITKNRLRYAIHNCQAIDGDDATIAMAVSSMDLDD